MDGQEVFLRLLVAVALGAAIGFERQWHQGIAGLRTNALVALGSALFVTVNVLTPGDASSTRVASQVVTGIGFLCAGVIMRQGLTVTGLNTAATLWCASAVGVVVGMGHLLAGAAGAAVIIVANLILRTVAYKLEIRQISSPSAPIHYIVRILCPTSTALDLRKRVISETASAAIKLRGLNSERRDDGRSEIIADLVSFGRHDDLLESFVAKLEEPSDSVSVRWEIAPIYESPQPSMFGLP